MSISFNPNTVPQRNQSWSPPLSEGILAQGFSNLERNTKELQSNFNNQANSIFGISSPIEQDQKVLQAKQKAFQEGIKNIKVNDLTDPKTSNQINQFITQYENDPDILGIAQRAASINKELQTKKDYESKGKTYVSPLLRQAENYINQGVYLRDTKFNKSGFVAPDNKDIAEAAKSTPEYETWVKNGAYDDHLKGKAVGQLQNNILNLFKTDPQWQQLHKDNFEQQIEGQDLSTYLDNPAQTVAELFPHLPKELQPQAQQYIQQLQSLKGNPYGESAIKNRLEDLYFQDQAALAAQAHTYANTVDHKVNEFAKSANDFQEAKALELFKHKLDNGDIPGIKGKLSELDKTVYQAVVASGKPIYDQNGTLIPAKDLASQVGVQYNASESRDNKTSTSEKSPLPPKLKSVFETIYAGVSLNTAEQEDLASYVESNREALGAAGKADILNVRYETDNGVKKIKWQKDEWGKNPEFEAYIINSQEEYDKVPQGAIFIDATGKPTKKQ